MNSPKPSTVEAEMKEEMLKQLLRFLGNYHHAVFMERYEQAEMFWREIELLSKETSNGND